MNIEIGVSAYPKICGVKDCDESVAFLVVDDEGKKLLNTQGKGVCERHVNLIANHYKKQVNSGELKSFTLLPLASKCSRPDCPNEAKTMFIIKLENNFDSIVCCAEHEDTLHEAVKAFFSELTKGGRGAAFMMNPQKMREEKEKWGDGR